MSAEGSSHSFVIRLWHEEQVEGKGQLRGHITHLPGEERVYLHDPEDVMAFLAPYLSQMEVKIPLRTRLILFLSKLGWRKRGGKPPPPF